jgi:hypothetical protein
MKQVLERIHKKEMPWTNRANQSHDSLIFNQQYAFVKTLASRHGIEVFEIKDGFLVSRWNMCKQVYSKQELENFLIKMGVRI